MAPFRVDRTAPLAFAPGVISRRNPDGSVVALTLDEDDHYFELTEMAAESWMLVNGKRSLAQISAQLSRRHQVSERALAPKLAAWMRELVSRGLINVADPLD